MSMNDLGVTEVTAIVAICYLAATAVKATSLDNKWLPVICGVLGGILGAVGYVFVPGFPAGDAMTAAAVGIVSGLAATGAHQVYKQLSDKSE